MLHRLDPAFERRFDMKLEFRRPETDVKETIKSFLKPEFELIIDRVDPITERRTKLSFAEFQGVANRMMKKAVLNNATKIKMSDVYLDLGKTMNVKVAFHTDVDADIEDMQNNKRK